MRGAPILLLVLGACASSGRDDRATLEVDGSWAATFETDRDSAYHAAMSVLGAEGYTIVRADPLGGSFTAKSEVKSAAVVGQRYTLAHVVVEPAPDRGMRIRLMLTRAREPAGHGRSPNYDKPVKDRGVYEELFSRIEETIGS